MSFTQLIPPFKKRRLDKDYTKLMREDSEVQLKISKMEFDESTKDFGDCVDSSIFPRSSDAHFKWQVRVYPLGQNENCSGYVSVFLYLTYKKIHIPVSTCARFIFKTATTCLVTKDLEHVYKKSGPNGFEKFCEVNSLRTFNADYFFMCVQVSAYYEANSCFTSNFSSERKLLQNYSSLLESGAFSDLVLRAERDKIEFNVHRNILASRSEVFAAMLSSNMKEKQSGLIEIRDLSSSTIKNMLNFIYSSEVEFTSMQSTLELLVASDKYDLKDLVLQCIEYLTEILNRNNVGIILIHAHQYNISDLKTTCLKYICKNTNKLMDKRQYQIIRDENPDLLLDIISEFSKYIDVDKVEL